MEAILGGRKAVTTQEKIEDNREVYLIIKGEERVFNLKISKDDYSKLKAVIPEKEIGATSIYSRMIKDMTISSDNNTNNNNIYDEIKKLANLKDEGLLTEEEFNAKKQELLNRI